MTTMEEIRKFAENMMAKAIVLEGHVATLNAQLATAGVKFIEIDAEVNKMKGQIGKGGKPTKDILESKAFQNLGELSGPKEYRY